MIDQQPIAVASSRDIAEALGCRRCKSLEESLRNTDDERRAAHEDALAARDELAALRDKYRTLRADYAAALERFAHMLLSTATPAERAAIEADRKAGLS